MARLSARRRAPVVYLIEGEDAYRRDEQRRELIERAVPEEARDFAVARFSLRQTPLADVLRQALTRPMLGPCQALIVTELDAIDEAQGMQLEEYLRDPPEYTLLIFEAARLDDRTRVARLLRDRAEVLTADAAAPADARQTALRFARELGLQLSPVLAQDLADVLGTDAGVLRRELEKLRALLGKGGEVTREALASVVVPARKFEVFELSRLLAERRRAEALALVARLKAQGESAAGIVGLLAWLYRQLLSARAGGRVRARAEQAAVIRAQAPRFSRRELRRAFTLLLEADDALKSALDKKLEPALLENLVVRLTAGPERAPMP